MSHAHRLRDADRIFFVTVNLRRAPAAFHSCEYANLVAAIEAFRAKLGFKLLGLRAHARSLARVALDGAAIEDFTHGARR